MTATVSIEPTVDFKSMEDYFLAQQELREREQILRILPPQDPPLGVNYNDLAQMDAISMLGLVGRFDDRR